ncbi:serine carboxypeptidase CPVL, partial [Biomphalaria glabrata]
FLTAMFHILWMLFSVMWCVSSSPPMFFSEFINRGKISEARNWGRVKGHYCQMPESFSGYIRVDNVAKKHVFFWFFPSKHNTSHSPLVIWLQGGPGRSSLEGLLWENGPLQIVVGKIGSITCKPREISWTDTMSMLYIDSPVGTGFSYVENKTAGYRLTRYDIARDLTTFLKQFYKLFPEYKSRELYIGGEDYAAKYVISFAYRLHTQQKNVSTNLKGLYLSGPLFAPEIQFKSGLDLLFAVGAISYRELVSHRELANSFFDNNRHDKKHFDKILFNKLMHSFRLRNPPDNYASKSYNNYSAIETLINRRLREYLNVGNNTFHFYNYTFSELLLQDFKFSSKYQLAELLKFYKVLMFSGEFDALFSPSMVDFGMMSTPWGSQQRFNESKRREWKQKRRVVGNYVHVDRLCRVVIAGSGHYTSIDRPSSTMDMMNQFIQKGCVGS